ncbi:peptide deformylase [Legionella worsleiensis]|uniref:Peptide deformylase n=1 Tax=Legionella worsleiensis TaxID=45076 RepID=A0A0W1AAD6_9GAMM|nr:peptide deformylase [Legionella worsleiensis]KTD78301.1 polypeptide deformylase [Legionella worsleiensis]STY32638.1 polypeptide deformylase [Legionella worsleiensis]
MDIAIVTVEQPEYSEVLTRKAEKVTFPLQPSDKKLIAAMKTKVVELGGVGLAAPQVNQAKQIIVVYIPEEARLLRDNIEATYPVHVMINPSYEPVESKGKTADYEGCYSVSSKAGKVPRYQSINVSYVDEQGQEYQKTETGFYARVLQHEIDHLNGVLITDRLTPNCIQGTPEQISLMRRNELSEDKKALFDEIMKKKMKK